MSTRTAEQATALASKPGNAAITEPLTLGARLMTLSSLMRRITAHRFQRFYNLTLVEGWIISHLGGGGAMSLDALAHRAGLAKSQMSRGVTQMVQRRLVDRRRNPEIHNEVILTLTAEGKEIYADIKRRWPGYNKLLLTGVSEAEQALLVELITELIDNSRRNLAQELEQSEGRSKRAAKRPAIRAGKARPWRA